MSRSRKKQEHIYRPPLPPRWRGRDSLELVYELNERCLQLLRAVAAAPNACRWPAIAQHRELWSALDAESIKRAGHFSFVFLDVHFTDVIAWQELVRGKRTAMEASSETCLWPPQVAAEVTQETLVFAWHTAKWDRRVARLALGMLPSVAECIAALTPQALATVASRASGALCLRWQDYPEFWVHLLMAARDDDQEVLEEIRLHAQLLIGRPALPRHALSRRSSSASPCSIRTGGT
jgi:hypothetical protein